MNTALAYTALLFCIILIGYLVGRKAARAETELKYAKESAKRSASSAEIFNKYINLSSAELSDRVRKKRETAQQRMRSQSGLDGHSTGQPER